MLLACVGPADLDKVAETFGLSTKRIRSWLRAYQQYSPELLNLVAAGTYDSPDSFLTEMQLTSTSNFYFQHAIRCRLSGLSVINYSEEYASVDPTRVEEFYTRVRYVPLDQLESIVQHEIVFTPVNYANLILNLRITTKALFAAAQAEYPEPLLKEEASALRILSNDLSWAVRRLECCIASIPVTKPSN